MRINHDYDRGGALAYLAAYDVHRAQVFGRCAPSTGIEPLMALAEPVMRERTGRSLGFGFDGVDFSGGVRGDGAIADGKFHRTRDDGTTGPGGRWAGVLLDVGEDGVEALGGGFADVEFADGGTEMVLEGAPVGGERGG